jgi:hypothetical protein
VLKSDLLSQVYQIPVHIISDPISHIPLILPESGKGK